MVQGPRKDAAPIADVARGHTSGTEVFEIWGTVKWFDVSKGFGFIVPNNGLADVFLHFTHLRAGGWQTAYEGSRIHCEVVKWQKGLQVCRVLAIDDSTAIQPLLLPQTHVQVKAESDWETAKCKWFNRKKGYGFLTRGEGTQDIYVHALTLRHCGFAFLEHDQIVQVRWGTGSKGCMVAELRPCGGEALGIPSTTN